jgi:hypothetical protein
VPSQKVILLTFATFSIFAAMLSYRVNVLTEVLPFCPQVDGKRLVIHMDNARPHITRKYRTFWKENRLRLAVHPPNSPDLAPSGFSLFGRIKHSLPGISFPSREELLAAIHEIVTVTPRPTLKDMFRHWMERLEWVSQNNGDCYP